MKRMRIKALVLTTALLAVVGFAAAKEKGGKAKDAGKEAGVAATTMPRADLPADLNAASLRVQAIDTIYQLDLSPAQIKALHAATTGVASDQKRTTAPANAKLADALSQFAGALLARADDDDIAKLRNDLAEQTDDDTAGLDDDVAVTAAARPKAAAFARQLDAGQIAAYLASHADQVTDPAETMLSTLAALPDAADATEADAQLHDASDDVGRLIAGADAKAAAAITAKAADWFKTNRALTADQQTARHDALEASAKKVLGDVPPMEILGHWMDNAMAELLSNPQTPQAADAVLAAKDH